jgi:hypothetical protein
LSPAWPSKPAVADQSLLFEINTVRPKYPWKNPNPGPMQFRHSRGQTKPAMAYHELLLEIRHRVPRIERKHPPLHPTKRKNHVSLPNQDKTKHNPSPLQLRTSPKEREKLIYKQKPTTTYWGGSPPPLSRSKGDFARRGKNCQIL